MKNNKSLGQHWLYNRAILNEIADLAAGYYPESSADEIAADRGELCVEIGPGLGTLTASLLKRFNRVIAVEYDARLADNLPRSFPGTKLEVINGDILQIDLANVTKGNKYVIAGNIPYYITSPILEKVLTAKYLQERVVLLMQKEVAERILSEKETQLSLFVKNRARALAGPVVMRDEFTPPPKVDSMVLVLEPHSPEVSDEVFGLIRQGFASPRKKLIHNLSGLKSRDELVRIMNDLGINPDARPGDLSLATWANLYNHLHPC